MALGCEINFAMLGEKRACAATKGEKVAWNFMVCSAVSAFHQLLMKYVGCRPRLNKMNMSLASYEVLSVFCLFYSEFL
jgi:hypothetical protein